MPHLRILSLVLLPAMALANTEVIRLDMSPVRGPVVPPATTKYPIAASPPAIPPKQEPDVFCTDGENIDDVLCDMRRLYGSDVWRTRFAKDLREVEVDYPDGRRKGVKCTASFERSNRTESILRLPFWSFKCEGGDDRETGLPPFRMSLVTTLRVITRKPDDYYGSCTFTFEKRSRGASGITVPAGGRAKAPGPLVRFHYTNVSCVSPVVFDRETTVRPPAPCGDDGRRCRPRNA